jgi:predicted nuclease with TOPRIM domain
LKIERQNGTYRLEFLLCTLTPEIQCQEFLKSENSNLMSENHNLKSENHNLESENHKLKSENHKLKSENPNLKSETKKVIDRTGSALTPEIQCQEFHRNHVIWRTKITKF